jgi:hypothetical protein
MVLMADEAIIKISKDVPSNDLLQSSLTLQVCLINAITLLLFLFLLAMHLIFVRLLLAMNVYCGLHKIMLNFSVSCFSLSIQVARCYRS